MSYFVSVTFDLESGDTEDYKTIYEDFEKNGLKKRIESGEGNEVTLPTTTTAGEFQGNNAGEIRNDICEKTKAVFSKHGYNGQIFVHVGGDWAWGNRTT